jgi:predicted dehydrogenase
MLSHRIDFAHILVGDFDKIIANMKIFHPTRGGEKNDLDEWVGVIGEFKNGATGMLESSKLATGRGESWESLDFVEVNGSEGTIVFLTGKWNELLIGKILNKV